MSTIVYRARKNPYGFQWEDYTWGKLQTLLGLDEDDIAFDRVACDVRCLMLKYFTAQHLDKHSQVKLFGPVKAKLKAKEPTLFGGNHGDRCLSFVFELMRKLHNKKHYRYTRYKKKQSESAITAAQTTNRSSSTAVAGIDTSLHLVSRMDTNPRYHSVKRREKMRPVVLLTRTKKFAHSNARESLHDTGELPQRIPQNLDSFNADHSIESILRESSAAQHLVGSERSISSAVTNSFQNIHPEVETTAQNTVYSRPLPFVGDVAGPRTFRTELRGTPQGKRLRQMPDSFTAPGLFHRNFQLDKRSVRTAALLPHEPQLPSFGSQSISTSSLPSNDQSNYFGASSVYVARWKPVSDDLRSKKEKTGNLVAATYIPSDADLSSKEADRPVIKKGAEESLIAAIHRFLSKCRPPMMQHILRFVEFGCTTTEYLRGVSTWPAEQRHKLLVKILQPERGGAVPRMDIAVLENQFDTYFRPGQNRL